MPLDAPLDRFAPLLEALHCGACIVGPRNRILYANRWVTEFLGVDRDLLTDTTALSPFGGGDWQNFVQTNRYRTPVHALEFYITKRGRTPTPVLVSSEPLTIEGLPKPLTLLTIVSAAPRKRAEQQYLDSVRQLSRLSDTAIEQALRLKHKAEHLEHQVQERNVELNRANMDAIWMLAVASEAKDYDTGAHVRRLQAYSEKLARELNFIPGDAYTIGYSAILHDVGKIHIPDSILSKPQSLTPDERAVMTEHTVIGERILSRNSFFEPASRIARSHHENWDGSGYPDRLAAGDIPLEARIVHLADVYDALTTPRAYKPAWTACQAIETIKCDREKMFDPEIVDAFLALVDRDEWQSEANGDGDAAANGGGNGESNGHATAAAAAMDNAAQKEKPEA